MLPSSSAELYAEGWRRRAADERIRQGAVRDACVAQFRAVLRGSYDRFSLSDAILFGSRASGLARKNADWDIAVAGLPPEQWHALLCDLEAAFGTERVDLVRIEEISGELLASVAKGVRLDG